MTRAGLAIAASDAATEEPWLEVTSPVRAIEVHHTDRGADAFVNITLSNRLTSRVHVDEVRIDYRSADDLLRSELVGGDFSHSTEGEMANVVESRGKLEWAGICLGSPPESATLARFVLTLSSRKGSRKAQSTLSIDYALRSPPAPILLHLPFDGYWRVTQAHSCGTNHRAGGRGGEYAWDFASAERGGKPSGKNRDSQTFGQPVLAPVDGRIIRVVNDVADNEGLREFPRRSLLEGLQRPEWVFGNFIVLDVGGGAFVLLGHLQQGSVAVEPGQTVRAGDALARAGNSGNTVMSHLHLQVMDRADPADAEVRGLPARFTSYTEITAPGEGAGRDLFIRRVSAGDPPEESVIAPFYPDPPRGSSG